MQWLPHHSSSKHHLLESTHSLSLRLLRHPRQLLPLEPWFRPKHPRPNQLHLLPLLVATFGEIWALVLLHLPNLALLLEDPHRQK